MKIVTRFSKRRLRALYRRPFSTLAKFWQQLIPNQPAKQLAWLVVVLLFAALGFDQFVTANNPNSGKYRSIPAAACTSDTWLNPEYAVGIAESYSTENSPLFSKSSNNGALVCTDFTDMTEQRSSVALGLRFSTVPQSLTSIDSTSLQEPLTQSVIKDNRERLQNANSSTTIDPSILISYSRDGGQSWLDLGGVILLENLDWSDVLVVLPDDILLNPDQLQFSITPVRESQPIAIDSVYVSYQIEDDRDNQIFVNEFRAGLNDDRPVVAANDGLRIKYKTKSRSTSTVEGLIDAASSIVSSSAPNESEVEITVRNKATGQPLDIDTKVSFQGVDVQGYEEWEVQVEPRRDFSPGEYSSEITYQDATSAPILISQDFLWGVLAFNTDKNSYVPDDVARLEFAVLDELGKMVCNAELQLEITGPNYQNSLSTSAGQIVVNDVCESTDYTEIPDYQADWPVPSNGGEYSMVLTAETKNGTYSVSRSTNVDLDPDFSLSRSGPTRIFPVQDYPMTFTISARSDVDATIVEAVPSSFKLRSITPLLLDGEVASGEPVVTSDSDTTYISWPNAKLRTGSVFEATYIFDAPDKSPEFYLLGPLEVNQSNTNLFTETEPWQVASDAVGRMLLFWDGATIPSGWECVSCTSGDPFFQRFVKAAAVYGAVGGAATHTHTASATVSTNPAATTENRNGPEIANVGHAHTYSPSLNSPSNLPSFRQLRIIRAIASGEPATIPAGAIAVFDATIPSGWTQYSAQNGAYIRGENTIGTTGGSNTHTVTISGNTSPAANGTEASRNGGSQTTGATATHSHAVNATSAAATNEPQFIEVILGKKNVAGTAPNNMIAMWDDELPSGWITASASGDSMNQRYLKPATSFGVTGGSNTHTHANTTGVVTGTPSATINGRTGTAGAGDSHTHTVNISNYSTVNHEPPYREALFGKRNQRATYEQSAYRWYENNNSTDVGAPLSTLNTAATAPAQGVPFRLRIAAHVSVENAPLSDLTFKLQYAAASGTCDTNFIGESYTDVLVGSGGIQYFDNTNATDGASLTSNANDPTHGSDILRPQTYRESNPFTNSQSVINTGEDGYWDFSLVDISATAETTYCFRVVKSDNSTINSYTQIPTITTAVAPPQMMLLYDGATIPSGWTCVSCVMGDEIYLRFLRGEAAYGVIDGTLNHSHSATASVGASTDLNGRLNAGVGVTDVSHTHSYTPTINSASNLPSYRQLKVIRYNAGTPNTIPAGAIALFDAAQPAGWTQYSAQNGQFVRGAGAVTTGGSNTVSHTISGTTAGSTGGEGEAITTGQQVQSSSSSHTHTVSGSSPSADIQPPFIEVILAQANTDTALPPSMIAMWTKSPGGSWSCISCSSGQPLYRRFFKPATSYGATGGSQSHTHTQATISTGSPNNTVSTRSGTDSTSDAHTHTVTVDNFTSSNHLPPYINVLFAKSPTNNDPPLAPSNLSQTKSDLSVLSTGAWNNEASVRFTADLDDPDPTDNLSLCVELQPLGTPFSNIENNCSAAQSYSGTTVSADLVISGLIDGEQYHWQARTKDAQGAYSSWVAFGGNAESARDFGIDTSSPTGTVYDGTTNGVDVEYNSGSLSQLSANWNIDTSASGLSGFEYAIGTTPGGQQLVSYTSIGTTTSVTESGLTLKTSEPYYFTVRATDNAGNFSEISSDGQFVAPTLSFSVSSSQVTFNNLSASNNYTDTELVTLTTSTNAYQGYEISTYIQSPLTSATAQTIANFSGTYASPAEWTSGQYGWGYTVDDPLVGGINRFNPAGSCLGGGSSPCYAAFANTPPGDVVADNTSLIQGSPVINEVFNLTQRITVEPAQAAGTYRGSLIYSVTPRY